VSNIDQCKQKLEGSGVWIYEASPTLMFALTDEKVFVMTSFHTFFLRHTHRNYLPRIRKIRSMIESEQINKPTELISALKLRVGEGVEMVVTDLSRHIGASK